MNDKNTRKTNRLCCLVIGVIGERTLLATLLILQHSLQISGAYKENPRFSTGKFHHSDRCKGSQSHAKCDVYVWLKLVRFYLPQLQNGRSGQMDTENLKLGD